MNKINKDVFNYLSYNHSSGVIKWIKQLSSRGLEGTEAGCYHHKGYKIIGFKGVIYLYHRIAWYLYHGEEPNGMIDHINGIKDDNRIDNLRIVTSRENNQNRKYHRDGKLVGANFDNGCKKYRPQIRINNKNIHLGSYDTSEEAHEVYMNKLNEYMDVNIDKHQTERNDLGVN